MSKVVVIDDNVNITNMIETALTRYELDYLVFNSSSVFLGSLESIKDDVFLFIIDLMMESISGLELIKIIRSKNIKTPIYVITGYLEDKAIDISKDISKFYTKPFDVLQFMNDIKELKINQMTVRPLDV